jgi:acid stress-induced BolA-like protein IbaG/YrbA
MIFHCQLLVYQSVLPLEVSFVAPRPRIHALSLVTQTPEEVNADDDGQ